MRSGRFRPECLPYAGAPHSQQIRLQ